MKPPQKENSIIICARDQETGLKLTKQSTGPASVDFIFHSGFKPTEELIRMEGVFTFYNSVHMLHLKLHWFPDLDPGDYYRSVFKIFVFEGKATLRVDQVLVALDGSWVAEGRTLLSVSENHATVRAPCSGVITTGNTDYTVHSTFQYFEKPHKAKTLSDYFGLQPIILSYG